MRGYDYKKEIKQDILQYIDDVIDFTDFDSIEELEKCLFHNFGLLREAVVKFGNSYNALDGAKATDVAIRSYLLAQCISELLDKIASDFERAHERA